MDQFANWLRMAGEQCSPLRSFKKVLCEPQSFAVRHLSQGGGGFFRSKTRLFSLKHKEPLTLLSEGFFFIF